jgi:hypothetical protein
LRSTRSGREDDMCIASTNVWRKSLCLGDVCDLLQCLIVTIIGGDRSVMATPSWWFSTCLLFFFLLLSLFSHLLLVSTPILSKTAKGLVILVLCKIYSSFFLLLFFLDHFLLIFFQFYPLLLGLLGIEFHDFFFLPFMR